MENDKLIIEELKAVELAALQAEITGPCDVCREKPGTAWLDSQWLCPDCLSLYGQALDDEGRVVSISKAQLRQRGIGGSDVPAILGMDPYRDPFSVAMEKRGELEPPPASPRMIAGKFLERGIMDYYSWVTGRKTIWDDRTRQHPQYPWFLWTPDALCQGEMRGVDAKLIAVDQAHLWGPSVEHIPKRYRVQAAWYMAASGYPQWDIAAMIGSDDLRIYTCVRDPALEAALITIAREFWVNCVLGDDIPIIGTTEASERYLRQKYPRNRMELRRADEFEETLLDHYRQQREEHEIAGRLRERTENRLKLAIGDADGIYTEDYRFTYKNSKDSVECDWQSLAAQLLEHLPEAEREFLITTHSRTKPGSRRMHWRVITEKEKGMQINGR